MCRPTKHVIRESPDATGVEHQRLRHTRLSPAYGRVATRVDVRSVVPPGSIQTHASEHAASALLVEADLTDGVPQRLPRVRASKSVVIF
jgi:hypothetical protein